MIINFLEHQIASVLGARLLVLKPSTSRELREPVAGKTAELAAENTMKRCRALGAASGGYGI